MVSRALVSFYKLWHGTMGLKGAGKLLGILAPRLSGLQSFPQKLPCGSQINLDFRDVSGFVWLNEIVGDRSQEDGLIHALVKFLKKDGVFWDVGANCGFLSYRVAVERECRTHVFFEPNEEMFRLASDALSSHSFVSGLKVGLSDHSGTESFHIPVGGSTTGTLDAEKTGVSGEVVQIECRTADQLVEEEKIPPPTVVKIDTEGHETAVLKGMDGTVRKHKPVIFFEHISMTDEEVEASVFEDYRLYSVSDKDGSLHPGFDRSLGHNSVLIPENLKFD
jgi:FkbM family methyltransferase